MDTAESDMGNKAKTLTEEQEKWFKDVYPSVYNDEICKRLGVCKFVVWKLAKKYGLKKSKEFYKERNLPNYKKMQEALTRMREKEPEKLRESYIKANKTRAEMRNRDKRRIELGMKPLTRMRITLHDEHKKRLNERRKALKKRGYHTSDSYLVYYDENTSRSKRENQLSKNHGFRFLPIEKKNERFAPSWN